MNKIDKNKIIFLDTNILSDIGRLDLFKITTIVYELIINGYVIALTPFLILEIDAMPDIMVKNNVHYFLNLVTSVIFKAQNEIVKEEFESLTTNATINPVITTVSAISKVDGKPANYMSILEDLRNNEEYKSAVVSHYNLIETIKNNYSCFDKKFTAKTMLQTAAQEKLGDEYQKNIDSVFEKCPAFLAFYYSLYDKIGSKGLKKKSGEMNDTAMSYMFPYIGTIVTEKRQANLFERLKQEQEIKQLSNTKILKHSDVFTDNNGINDFVVQKLFDL